MTTARARQERQLRQSDGGLRISAETIMARIGHDFRTLVGRSLGAMDLLADEHLDEGQRQLVAVASDAMERQWEILQSMQDLLLLTSGDTQIPVVPFDLGDLIGDAIAGLVGVSEDQEPRLSRPGGPARVLYGDEDRLRRLLTDLMQLAHDRRSAGGIVVSYAHGKGVDGSQFVVRIADVEAKDESDSDLDLAMPSDDTSSWILHPGFIVSQHLATALGMELLVANQGRPPLHLRLSGASRVPTAAVEPPQLDVGDDFLAGRSVLIVEDDAPLAAVIGQMVRRMGGMVSTAADGAEAIELTGLERYDLILMDCNMPVMDGFTAARRIRIDRANRNVRTPILAITALTMRTDRQRCLRAGMDDCLFKPFGRDEFIRAVGGLLGDVAQHPSTTTSSSRLPKSDASSIQLPAVDRDLLGQTITLVGDGAEAVELVRGLLNQYRADWPATMDAVRSAWTVRDRDQLRLRCHRLKSQARILGFAQQGALLARFEAWADEGRNDEAGWQRASRWIAVLSARHPATLLAMEQILNEMEGVNL